MKTQIKIAICLFILILSVQVSYSQQIKSLWLDSEQLITSLDKSDVSQHLKKQLKVPNDYEFRIRTINGTKNVTDFTDDLGYTHERYTQYYKGIKVEHSDIRLHYRGDAFVSANGEYIDAQHIDIATKLSKEEAIQQAKKYVNAKEYMWENEAENNWLKSITNNERTYFYPTTEIVICKNSIDIEDITFHVAYKIDIYAKEPLRHDYIFVDAKTGHVLNTLPILINVNGTAQTRYTGQRTISTQQNGTTYRLRDNSRGDGIETYNLKHYTSTLTATDFTDNNNNWTVSEYHNTNKDAAALDAHWGAMMTYDYFKNVHNRNSYDSNGSVLKNYVHYGNNYDNAGWDMNFHHMIYGDGGTIFDAVTALDVIAHEIAHGVWQFSAELV